MGFSHHPKKKKKIVVSSSYRVLILFYFLFFQNCCIVLSCVLSDSPYPCPCSLEYIMSYCINTDQIAKIQIKQSIGLNTLLHVDHMSCKETPMGQVMEAFKISLIDQWTVYQIKILQVSVLNSQYLDCYLTIFFFRGRNGNIIDGCLIGSILIVVLLLLMIIIFLGKQFFILVFGIYGFVEINLCSNLMLPFMILWPLPYLLLQSFTILLAVSPR